MQIRVATRQDEPLIREILNQVAQVENSPQSPTLKVGIRHSDLINVDSQYFGEDGIFIVAEDEGTIVGCAGAHRGELESVLELKHLVVIPEWRRRGIGKELFAVIEFFAGNAEYTTISVHVEQPHVQSKGICDGFHRDELKPGRWIKQISGSPAVIAKR